MASRLPKHAVNITVEIPATLHNLAGGPKLEFKLSPKELAKSWMECIKSQNDKLAKKLATTRYTIMDKRPKKRLVWKLSAKISSFIDNFGRILQKYTAAIGTMPINTEKLEQASNSQQNQSNARNTGQSSNSKGVSFDIPAHNNIVLTPETGTPPKPSTSSSLKRKLNQNNQIQTPKNAKIVKGLEKEKELRFGGFNSSPNQTRAATRLHPNKNPAMRLPIILPAGDDSASMAESVFSQDSQDDLFEDGVEVKEIKEEVMKRIAAKVDNSTLLRVKQELEKLMNEGKFLRACKYLPFTCNLLQIIFNHI